MNSYFTSIFAGICGLLLICRGTGTCSVLKFEGAPVQLTVSRISDSTVRVQLVPVDSQGRLQAVNNSPALASFLAVEKLRLRELEGSRKLDVGQLKLTIKASPLTVSVRRSDGTLVQELVFADGEDTNAVSFRTEAPVFGLGEGGPQFDRRGHLFPLQNGERTPTLAVDGARVSVPFLIGADGWALFLAAPMGEFDLSGQQGLLRPRRTARTGEADVFVTDARRPANALREFVRLTGAPILPPKWALGYMQSHRTLSSEADILAEARKFREEQLPCDAVIYLGTGFCPAGWNEGHDSFDFNTNVFTHDAATVINELHTEHLHVVLHVVPLQRDYPALHGQIPAVAGETLDAQDIGVYWNRHSALFNAGVDGWWPDEGDWLDVPSRLERHRLYYEGSLSERPNVRPWNLQRNGYAGIARYGGWIWSGDIASNWKTLREQVAVGLNSSLSVSPFWGTDIGGFSPVADREFTGELYARWFQFAAFCPSFRSHGRTWQLHLPWGWNTGETGPVEARPSPDPSELHNAAVEPVCRKYLDLRYQLMPYSYTIARAAHDTGLPMMRALWLQYPDDSPAAALGDEYLWGSDLLVAPVLEKGATSRRVYLPAGVWYDWWTGAQHSGPGWIERSVDLETMPIYVRSGAIIPLDPIRQYIAQPVSGPTTLQVYPGKDGDFTLYDDDGQSLAYLQASDPAAVWIHFRWSDQQRRLSIEPDARMKKWPGGVRVYQVQVISDGVGSKQVAFEGKSVTVNF